MNGPYFIIRYVPTRERFLETITDAEAATVQAHFQYLQSLHKAGDILLVGRRDDAAYGIAIFSAPSAAAARQVLEADPVVKAGVFSADVGDFSVVFKPSGGRKVNAVIRGWLALVAVQHLAFLVLEMFLWTDPIGLKVFNQSLEAAQTSATLAGNQGLYNGFLAAGLVWAALIADSRIATFFLSCVAVAGLYGAASVSPSIFFVQALPALVGLAMVFFFRRG